MSTARELTGPATLPSETALSAHTDAAWPCELVLLADHNYDLAAV